jgi:ATP-dependent phosphoenolpyruvate carboxykinase
MKIMSCGKVVLYNLQKCLKKHNKQNLANCEFDWIATFERTFVAISSSIRYTGETQESLISVTNFVMWGSASWCMYMSV